jgi:GNAT superfamily N-acetyltransferase
VRVVKPTNDRGMLTAPRPPQPGPLRRTPGEDRENIIDTLSEAFDDDPLYRWLFDERATRRQALRDNFTLVTDAALISGCLDTTPRADAVAIWTGPGRALFDDPSRLLTVLSRWASPIRLAAAGHAMTECSRHQPADAAVLHLIGVRPDNSGAGIGSTLIRRRLVELDRIGRTAYLESSNPRNHTFYVRHGFMPTSQVRLGTDGPSVTCMVRPASRTSP